MIVIASGSEAIHGSALFLSERFDYGLPRHRWRGSSQ